jgi:hypothetical protein
MGEGDMSPGYGEGIGVEKVEKGVCGTRSDVEEEEASEGMRNRELLEKASASDTTWWM